MSSSRGAPPTDAVCGSAPALLAVSWTSLSLSPLSGLRTSCGGWQGCHLPGRTGRAADRAPVCPAGPPASLGLWLPLQRGGPSPGRHSQPQTPRLGLLLLEPVPLCWWCVPPSLPFSLPPYFRDAHGHPVASLLPEGSPVLTVPSPQAPVCVLLSHLPFRPSDHQPPGSPGFTLLLPGDLHHPELLAAAAQYAPGERVSLPSRLQLRGVEEQGCNPVD